MTFLCVLIISLIPRVLLAQDSSKDVRPIEKGEESSMTGYVITADAMVKIYLQKESSEQNLTLEKKYHKLKIDLLNSSCEDKINNQASFYEKRLDIKEQQNRFLLTQMNSSEAYSFYEEYDSTLFFILGLAAGIGTYKFVQ